MLLYLIKQGINLPGKHHIGQANFFIRLIKPNIRGPMKNFIRIGNEFRIQLRFDAEVFLFNINFNQF